MVGGFFPAPYPDECLYSILCRYYVYSGSTSFGITARELFGNEQNVTSSIYLPIKIEYVDNWTSPSSGISRKTIAENHTLHPYWSITYPSDFRAETDEILNGGTITTKFNRFGTFKSRRSWSKYLKYCPVCANEDMNMYGETYWRRQHQISEMIYCTNHKVRLLNSEVPVKRTATGFYPATSEINANSDVDVPDNLLRHKEKFLKIGQESEWLIKYGLEVDWSVNGYEKYWKSLRDKGLASFQGRCDYLELESALSDYWGADFLKILFDMTDESHFERWELQIDKNKMRHYKPLHYILLMCFLAGNVDGFIKSNPADTPYGHSPFVCENPICPHYHIDGAEMVSLKYYSSGATAAFECIYCGLRYKHNKAKYSRELRVVADYGHLWDSELRRCCKDPKITNEQAMEILKCSMNVLLLQKKKRGLLEAPLYDTKIGAEKYYKMRVSELCEEYDDVTIAMLQEKVPGAYSYLGDHDPEWLRSHIVFENERKHVREREEFLANKLREVESLFMKNGFPKHQVTFGYVAKLIGATRDELRNRNSKPITSSLLERIIENKEKWLYRRTVDICTKRIALSKPTTEKTIKRELNLKSDSFAKHEDFVKGVISTIYEKNNI